MVDYVKIRKFTFDDQNAFAELSGDYNPLHIDPVVARRTIFGRQVVHGIHALLWALDNWFEGQTKALDLCTIKAEFQKAIEVGEEISYSLKRLDNNRAEIELLARGACVVWIDIYWAPSKRKRTKPPLKKPPGHHKCKIPSIEEAKAASGTLDLYINLKSAAKLFPNLMRIVPSIQIAEILATTRLVGMECPGLHSVYYGLDLVFSMKTEVSQMLNWEVSAYDKRFSSILMNIETSGMRGTIKAFFRPIPQEQVSFKRLHKQIDTDEFTGQKALIIGGSRGLGEVTAKILAAGGAEVRITYYQGAQDAQRVVNEIVSNGASADCFVFNVLDIPRDLTERLKGQWAPTHLYYFATPFIFDAFNGIFSPQLFRKFCDYYVTGFLNTIKIVRNLGSNLKIIFYPSSVAIDDLPLNMGEYASAKMAGEVLCCFLEKADPSIRIYKPRLPRTATDQTASLLPVKNEDPVQLMVENLRHLRDSSPNRSS
ncbi:MAG: SDR family NAD(P)-dependent oxidoreductase [Planctomycetes bacterium]|nr:SDR family NAD(P)-dependent oxidoreductase [Planctomycetota bacterium]